MNKTLLLHVYERAYSFAILEDGKLAALRTGSDDGTGFAGSIYRGKVTDVVPGINAAFVDIGFEKNAYLHIKEVLGRPLSGKIEHVLSTGQEITVQVIKEAGGSKGCRVSMHISLKGRLVILTKGGRQISVSKKIRREEDRERLKGMAQQSGERDFGILFRTAACQASDKDVYKEMDTLVTLFGEMKKWESKGAVPRLIYTDVGVPGRMVRDELTYETDKFVINDKDIYDAALEYAAVINPENRHKISLYTGEYPLFDVYGISSDIKRISCPKVWLKCGGYIIIEKTEALTVIDVNSGKNVGRKTMDDTILSTNMQAACEIARQIRLRDIGGIIVIDFIDMACPEQKDILLIYFRAECQKHGNDVNILGITRLGLMEMTRKKSGNWGNI